MENTQYAYINDIDSADEGEEEVSSSPPEEPRTPPRLWRPPPPTPNAPRRRGRTPIPVWNRIGFQQRRRLTF